MKTSKVKITNGVGLHARPASIFVKEASKFEANVNIIKGEKKINGKSIIGVMSLAAKEGEEIIIEAEGIDEEVCITKLSELVLSGFGEA